jgi:hypothetical protein
VRIESIGFKIQLEMEPDLGQLGRQTHRSLCKEDVHVIRWSDVVLFVTNQSSTQHGHGRCLWWGCAPSSPSILSPGFLATFATLAT